MYKSVNGVTWDPKSKKWRARISFKGKMTHLGFFEEMYAAVYARLDAERDFGIMGDTSASKYIDAFEG